MSEPWERRAAEAERDDGVPLYMRMIVCGGLAVGCGWLAVGEVCQATKRIAKRVKNRITR